MEHLKKEENDKDNKNGKIILKAFQKILGREEDMEVSLI